MLIYPFRLKKQNGNVAHDHWYCICARVISWGSLGLVSRGVEPQLGRRHVQQFMAESDKQNGSNRKSSNEGNVWRRGGILRLKRCCVTCGVECGPARLLRQLVAAGEWCAVVAGCARGSVDTAQPSVGHVDPTAVWLSPSVGSAVQHVGYSWAVHCGPDEFIYSSGISDNKWTNVGRRLLRATQRHVHKAPSGHGPHRNQRSPTNPNPCDLQ